MVIIRSLKKKQVGNNLLLRNPSALLQVTSLNFKMAPFGTGVSFTDVVAETKKHYQDLKREMDNEDRKFLDNMFECFSKIAEKADHVENTTDLVVLVTSIPSFIYAVLACKRVKKAFVDLFKVGGNGVGELQKELENEVNFIKSKLDETEKMIHETENDTYIKLSLFSQNIKQESTLTELVKEFNNSMFEIKKRVNECDRQLQISHHKVHDFLRRRNNARGAGIVTAAVGGGATAGFGGLGVAATVLAFSNPVTAVATAVIGVSVGLTAVITGTAIVKHNPCDEEERNLRAIEKSLEVSRNQLNEAINKLKEYISKFQSKNIPVANW